MRKGAAVRDPGEGKCQLTGEIVAHKALWEAVDL